MQWLFNRNKTIISEIDVVTLRGKLREEDPPLLIDIREPDEVADGYLEHAQFIPMRYLASKIQTVVSNKDREIVLYCRSGNRSQYSARELISLGYTHVFSLRGGILAWYREGYEIKSSL